MEQAKKGFALPMIVVTGFVLMIILAFSLQTISVSRDNLINQHAQLLARQAAESGLARAQQCMQKSNQLITWSEARPLKPNTDCNGNEVAGLSEYVSKNDVYQSYFEVHPSDMTDDFRNASSVGKVEILRRNVAPGANLVMKRYDHVTSAYVRTGLTFDDIQFGSVYNLAVNSGNPTVLFKLEAVFFHTKTLAGNIKGVGKNTNYILTGIPGDGLYTDGVDLKTEGYNGAKIKKIVTDFQGNGWNTFFLTYKNEIYSTGSNGRAQKGNGLHNSQGLPISSDNEWPKNSKMLLPDGVIVKDIKVSGSEVYILAEDGRLFVNGTNWPAVAQNSGRVWIGLLGCYKNCENKYFVHTPTRVMTDTRNLKDVRHVYVDVLYGAYDKVACAIGNHEGSATNHEKVYCWGGNNYRQIHNTASTSIKYASILYNSSSDPPVDVRTDGATVYILTRNGRVYARGNNQYNQIGSCGDTCSLTEIRFNGRKIKAMAIDSFSSLYLDDQGEAWAMGLNDIGQLGINRVDITVSSPVKVVLPAGARIVDIFIASPGLYRTTSDPREEEQQKYDARLYRNSFFVTEDGDVYGAGSNAYGQLGVGKTGSSEGADLCPELLTSEYNIARAAANQTAPKYGNRYDSTAVRKPVKMCLKTKKADGVELHKSKIGGVRAGIGTAIVITDKNKVFTVGNNHQGQLGAGDTVNRSIPEAHRLTNLWNVYYY